MSVLYEPGPELIEPIPVDDEFCCGLARIEDLGDQARFVLYSDQVRYEEENRPVRVVRKKIILPVQAIVPGVEMTIDYLARKGVRAAGDRILRLSAAAGNRVLRLVK